MSRHDPLQARWTRSALGLFLMMGALILLGSSSASADPRVLIIKEKVTVPLSVAMVELEEIIEVLGEDHPFGEQSATFRVRVGRLRERVRRGMAYEITMPRKRLRTDVVSLKKGAARLVARAADVEAAHQPEVKERLQRVAEQLNAVVEVIDASKPPPPVEREQPIRYCAKCPPGPKGGQRCYNKGCVCIYGTPGTSCKIGCTCHQGRWSCIPSPCQPTP